MNQYKNEIEYLKNKILEVIYNPEDFTLFIGEDKFLFGATSPVDGKNHLSKLAQYKTLYDTLINLDFKIKLSFENAIVYTYSDPVQDNFNSLHTTTSEEQLSYYFIENALFRTYSLWDILAQLYRLFYQINTHNGNLIPKSKVHYKDIFNPNLIYSSKFKNKAIQIHSYINENDDTNNLEVDVEWSGNHKYVNSCRNKMTHRNSPNITTFSDFDLHFKDHPVFMLKRIVEDYNVVSKYIKDILSDIKISIQKDFQ